VSGPFPFKTAWLRVGWSLSWEWDVECGMWHLFVNMMRWKRQCTCSESL